VSSATAKDQHRQMLMVQNDSYSVHSLLACGQTSQESRTNCHKRCSLDERGGICSSNYFKFVEAVDGAFKLTLPSQTLPTFNFCLAFELSICSIVRGTPAQHANMIELTALFPYLCFHLNLNDPVVLGIS
jgi:hypothetical protein